MIIAYLESIKYVGHLWPVALFRIIFGYQFLSLGIGRLQAGYLEHAYIVEKMRLSGGALFLTEFYFEFFKALVQSQWFLMTLILLTFEFVIAISYLIGFAVRLSAIMGMVLSLHFYWFFNDASAAGQLYLLAIHFLLLVLGAGRCLGVDYYFYKSRRGLFW